MKRVFLVLLIFPFFANSTVAHHDAAHQCMLMFSSRESTGFDDPADLDATTQETLEQIQAMMSPAAWCRLEMQRANHGLTACNLQVELRAIGISQANENDPEYSFEFTTKPLNQNPSVVRVPPTGTIKFAGVGELPTSAWDTDDFDNGRLQLYNGPAGYSYDYSEARMQLRATEHDNGPTALIDPDDHSSSWVKRAYNFPCNESKSGMDNRMVIANKPVGTDVDVTFFIDIWFQAT